MESASELGALAAAFSIISSYRGGDSVQSASLEDLTGSRVDLDAYELDDDLHTAAVRELRTHVFSVLAGESAVFTYRPSTFVSAICFARRDRCRYLGMFKDHQAAFEHKPWVESAVAELGIPHIPWTYVADEEQILTSSMLDEGPVMLRRSRTSGGTGLVKVAHSAELRAAWMDSDEAFVSVAPFLDEAIPVNIGAVAWEDGVTLHPPSLQIIGQPDLTTRPFGYCGNDFVAAGQFDDATLLAMETASLAIGDWLRRHGYRGAFGVDFLVKDGVPLFTEVNPRFQGSTHASAQISVAREESCILLDHLMSLLALPREPSLSLVELVRNSPALSHIVLHNTTGASLSPTRADVVRPWRDFPGYLRSDVLPTPALVIEPSATLHRVTVAASVTSNGFDLDERASEAVAAASQSPTRTRS